eukprot:8254125-Pyramimonas_sp.AAC.1
MRPRRSCDIGWQTDMGIAAKASKRPPTKLPDLPPGGSDTHRQLLNNARISQICGSPAQDKS